MSELRQRPGRGEKKESDLYDDPDVYSLRGINSDIKREEKAKLAPVPSRSPEPHWIFVLLPLLAIRLAAAIFSTIPDCDEVFNYWEPAHYLVHDEGFQTWEYSPVYAVRSWAYIALHAIVIKGYASAQALLGAAGVSLPGILDEKQAEFYLVRIVFALVCAEAETRLYLALRKGLSPSVANIFALMSLGSAGVFHASTAFLPSTFAIYTGMLGAASWLNGNTALSLTWFAAGAVLGWPFAAALAVPFILADLLEAVKGAWAKTIKSFSIAAAAILVITGAIVAFDTAAYRKTVIVPLNIVLYNVFGGEGKGPDIYGTEPWWFYLANLALNFNVLLPLALLNLVTLPIGILLHIRGPPSKAVIVSIPFYLWLGIFTLQPHKEERFMFPAYPFLLINAAISLNSIPFMISFLPSSLITLPPILVSALISLSRVLHITTSFSAPLYIYSYLPSTPTPETLCIGKEWYRFPSSFHLPTNISPAFITSSFRGLLPGHFPSSPTRAGTWQIPEGMNDLNEYDEGKVIPIDQCDYLVDLSLPSQTELNSEEPDYSKDLHWETIHCERWLDTGSSVWKAWDRRFWYPGRNSKTEGWGKYCLLKRVLPYTDKDQMLTMYNGFDTFEYVPIATATAAPDS